MPGETRECLCDLVPLTGTGATLLFFCLTKSKVTKLTRTDNNVNAK